ncbi:MAG: hypothetical protein ABIK86_04925, partial [candidate division WOR-3 bacterium]
GFVFRRKVGDAVVVGDVVAEVYSSDEAAGRSASNEIAGCYAYSRVRPRAVARVMGRLGAG